MMWISCVSQIIGAVTTFGVCSNSFRSMTAALTELLTVWEKRHSDCNLSKEPKITMPDG